MLRFDNDNKWGFANMSDQVAKVSIIIPSYNHAAWIEEALMSVFAQTLRDWELIIIDDASDDDSYELVSDYLYDRTHAGDIDAKQYRLLRHDKNQGATATLNEGLSLARGKYIAILNSDDVWDESRLQTLFDHAERENLDFLATKVRLWDKFSRLKNASEADWLSWYNGLQKDWQQHGDFLHTLLRGNFLITTSNFFFRREVYERLGGFSEQRYVHDYEYVIRMYLAACRMGCLWDDTLLSYRLHDSNTIRERPLAAIRENMGMLLRYMPEMSLQLNASRLHALQQQFLDLYRYTNEEWQSEVHWSLVAKERELFPLIEHRDEWIHERDQFIEQQQKHIDDRDAWIQDRDSWIAERDQLIKTQQEDIKRHQGWITERESWLSDRDEMISRRDAWVAERDGWIAERDYIIKQQQIHHEQLLASWEFRIGSKLLAPVRKLRQLFQQRGGRLGHA